MKTVHIIANAHLDPIWLWPWQAGLDEVLATCRSACERLEAHPEFIYNRGEAWLYQQVEKIDPALFARIQQHVASGRWNLVGGWWIQPDCNAPSGFAMDQQIRLGREYFESRFGRFPRTAYNVDSFGHAAFLPGLMRRHGQDRYVMMRPMQHEKAMDSSIFHWQGEPGGPTVLTYRIPAAYCMRVPDLTSHIEICLAAAPAGLDHAMCFMGAGDHGGGPTEAQILWCLEHAGSLSGVRLEFSTPDRFFDAVEKSGVALPTVSGELQMHAVGCFSVHRPVKLGLRRAEHLLAMAENLAGKEAAARSNLNSAWERVAFSQFHDTLGGTCLPSAYEQIHAHLGHAFSIADETLHIAVRRSMNALPDDPRQRLVFTNASGELFSGPVEFEPWLEWRKWEESWRLVDEQGQEVPFQLITSEAPTNDLTRLFFRLEIPAAGHRVLHIETQGRSAFGPSGSKASEGVLQNGSGTELHLPDQELYFPDPEMRFAQGGLPLPFLALLDDPTDTWSHGVKRYTQPVISGARWEAPQLLESGPLRAALTQLGHIGDSPLRAEWRIYAGDDMVELLLHVAWRERYKLLKFCVSCHEAVGLRHDGTMGGETLRPHAGNELPLRDRTWLKRSDGLALGVICPEVYALDGDTSTLRFTLLRSPLMAHHAPNPGTGNARVQVSDQGEHTFRFRFRLAADLTPQDLDREALGLHRPPVGADLTRGMPVRLTI